MSGAYRCVSAPTASCLHLHNLASGQFRRHFQTYPFNLFSSGFQHLIFGQISSVDMTKRNVPGWPSVVGVRQPPLHREWRCGLRGIGDGVTVSRDARYALRAVRGGAPSRSFEQASSDPAIQSIAKIVGQRPGVGGLSAPLGARSTADHQS